MARRNAGPLVLGGLVLLGIVGLALIYFILTSTGILSGSIIGGGGFTSIGACTQPNFNSNDPYYNNATYSCTFVAGGGSQALNFQLNRNTSSYFGDTVVENNVSFTGIPINDSCRYQADATTIYPVYQYAVASETAAPGYRRIRWDEYGGTYYCGGNVAYMGSEWEYLGTTPINCYHSNCRIYTPPTYPTGCVPVYRKIAGNIVYLDPSVVYNPQVQLNTTLYGSNGQVTENYINILSNQNTTFYNPVDRGSMLGSLQGAQSCPASPNVAIFVQNSGTNPLIYVPKDIAQSVITLGYTLTDPSTISTQASTYQARYNQMTTTTPNFGQLCNTTTNSGQTYQTASISCRPTTPASIPVLNVIFNGQKPGIHVRSGVPQIVSVSTNITTQGGQVSQVNVQTRNIANEEDTFEATLSCSQRDVQPFSGRGTIDAGATATIPITFEGAGFISSCNVEVHSINSPQNNANSTVRISIEPFCGKTAPNSAMQKVGTQYGCEFVCPNYGGATDVRETDCGEITYYDRCTSRNTTGSCTSHTYTSFTGYHCTGIGTYLRMNDYYDGVYRGDIQPFIPQARANQYFIVSDNGAMKCQYVNQYGYSDGQLINSFTFNPAIGIQDAQVSTFTPTPEPTPTQPSPGTTTPGTTTPTPTPTPTPGQNQTTPTPLPVPEQQVDNSIYIAGAIIALLVLGIAGFAVMTLLRKRR